MYYWIRVLSNKSVIFVLSAASLWGHVPIHDMMLKLLQLLDAHWLHIQSFTSGDYIGDNNNTLPSELCKQELKTKNFSFFRKRNELSNE